MSTGKESPGFTWVVPEGMDGCRLDAALAAFMPSAGLRARRRLWEGGSVLLDGRPAKPGSFVAKGQTVTVEKNGPACPGMDEYALKARIVKEQGGYVFLAKPAGLPSASIAGKDGMSAERQLEQEWVLWSSGKSPHNLRVNAPLLCNRLDTATSGLLTAALNERGVADFRRWESSGQAVKLYFALVRGAMLADMTIRQAIDAARRKKSLVLDEADPDRARHSAVRPLRVLPAGAGFGEEPVTLVRVLIMRGARHQIRAHLAWAGHPIVGDVLYGGSGAGNEYGYCPAYGRMFLHHAAIKLPVAHALLLPEWPGWPELSAGVDVEEALRL